MENEFPYIALGLILLAAFYYDVRTSTIPNRLTVGGALLGLLYHSMQGGFPGDLFFAAQGMLVGFGILFFMHLLRAVGAGDVKLFAAIGAFTGTDFVLPAIFYSMVFAVAAGIVMLLVKGNVVAWFFNHMANIFKYLVFRDKPRKERQVDFKGFVFPFMYGVLPGVIFTYYMFYLAY